MASISTYPLIEKPGLALDLDGVLADAGVFWAKIFIERFGNPENLTPEEIVRQYGYMQQVPYWPVEGVNELVQELRSTGWHHLEYTPIAQAIDSVREIHQHRPFAAYITARMEIAADHTRQWLQKHGFPNLPLITGPTGLDHSLQFQWKAGVLRELHPIIQGIVDDSKGLVEQLTDYPGTIYLFGQEQHEQQGERVIPCLDWQAVKRALL